MKNFSLGMKISFGFFILLVISCFLGGAGVFNMKNVEKDSKLLSKEYIPEVEIAVELRGAANRLMYELRGYGFTEDKQFFDNAQIEFEAVNNAIVKGRGLENKAKHLKKLKEQLDVAETALTDYKSLAKQTRDTSLKMKENRKSLETAAARYMDNCNRFLAGQKEKLQIELIEGQTRIQAVTELFGIGDASRAGSLKAEVTGSKALITGAMQELDNTEIVISSVRTDTLSEEDEIYLNDIASASKNYKDALRSIAEIIDSGVGGSETAFADARQLVESGAQQYKDACSGFIDALHDKLTNDMFERTTKINIINEIIDTGNAIRIASFEAQALRNPAVMENAQGSFEKINAGFEELKEITRLAADLQKIDEVKSAGESYNTGMTDFLANWLLLQEIGVKRGEAGKAVVKACENLANAGMGATVKISNDAVSSLSTASISMIAGLAAALIIGLLAAFLITRSITVPVGRTISNLTEVSEQVMSASDLVATASQSLAEGASEQAASIEETSASLEEMSSMTKQNAANSSQADSLMNDANKIVEAANNSMTELTNSMEEISKASEETSKIIKTIDEIAFQTNLLALNAAVEAARAGNAGAGFAVVADEVRNLAMRAADAAKNTAELIEGTVKRVDAGSELVTKTSEAFSAVADSTQKVGSLVGEISAASGEQAEGIEEINKTIVQMDKVTQQSAASAEESASASQEMTGQTRQMERAVEELIKMVGGRHKLIVKTEKVRAAEPETTENPTALPLPVVTAHKKNQPEDYLIDNKESSETF